MPNLRKIQRRLAERQKETKASSVVNHRLPIVQGLFLDDERTPEMVKWCSLLKQFYGISVEWTVVRTPEAFRAAIAEHNYEVYSFDYYLGRDDLPTGYDLACELHEQWKINLIERKPIFNVHSDHPNRFRLEKKLFEIENWVDEQLQSRG